MKKKALITGIALAMIMIFTACGKSATSTTNQTEEASTSVATTSESEETSAASEASVASENYILYSTAGIEYSIPESWTEKVSSETTKYYYPEDGMLMVAYVEINASITDDVTRQEFIDGFSSKMENFELISESEISLAGTKAYRHEMNLVSSGKEVKGSMVTFDYNNGTISFWMATSKGSDKDYGNEFENILSSIKLTDGAVVAEGTSEAPIEAPVAESFVDIMNEFASNSQTTDEIYVTGNFKVGYNEAIKPGIYDLQITGGSGNVTGTRGRVNGLYINWAAGAPGSGGNYASNLRIILFDGDELKLRNISKIKFNAIPEKVDASNELGIGEFIVGRDILAGNYKLSTNIQMDEQFSNLGWDIEIYDTSTNQTRSQTFNPGNSDVAISLKDGEIVSTGFYNTQRDVSTDTAKLIFSPM